MANIVSNGSFETGVAPGDSWSSTTVGAPTTSTTSFSTSAVDGVRALQLDLTINATGQALYIYQNLTTGFTPGDTLNILFFKKLLVNSITGGTFELDLEAYDSVYTSLGNIYSYSTSTVTTTFGSVEATSAAVPENCTIIQIILRVNPFGTGAAGSMQVIFDYLTIDVIPGSGTTSASGITASGVTHDVAFEYDSDVGVVGFTVLRDEHQQLGYFQEEAPIFGDPKTMSDSSASDFTLWRSSNQITFSDGMGQVDFDTENGTKKFLLLQNGRISDTGFIVRGPRVYTEALPMVSDPSASYMPDVRMITTYDASGNSMRFIAYAYYLFDSISYGNWASQTFGFHIVDMTTFKRIVYLGFGDHQDVMVNVIGGDAFSASGGNRAVWFGTGEGFIVRIKPDANGVGSTLESSTDGAAWTNTKQYDDAIHDATGALAPGFFQGLFYFGAPDGLYSWDGTTSTSGTALVLSFGTAASGTNARRIRLFKGKLYFTIGSDVLYEFDGATAPKRITEPWSSEIIAPEGGVYEGTISWLDVQNTTYKLYVSVACLKNDGTTRYSLIMSFDGTAWAVEYKHDGAWLMLGAFDINRLYMFPYPSNGLLYYISADRNLLAADEDRDTRILQFRSSRLNLQRPLVDKLVSGVYVRHRNITPTVQTTVATQVNAGDTTMTLRSVTGISVGDWLWVDPNEATAEVKYVSAVNVGSNTVTFSAPPSSDFDTTDTIATMESSHPPGDTVARLQLLTGLYDVSTGITTMVGGAWDDSVGDQLITLPESSPFISKKLEIRGYMIGTASSPVSMELREWALRYIYLPPAKRRWRLSLNLRQGVVTFGRAIESRTSEKMMQQIWAAKGARRLVRYYDIDGTSYLGRLGQPEFRIEEIQDSITGAVIQTMVCTLNFIETDSEIIK